MRINSCGFRRGAYTGGKEKVAVRSRSHVKNLIKFAHAWQFGLVPRFFREGGTRMVRTLLMVTLLFAFLSASAYAAESYLCVADMATGFKFDENRKEWETATFKESQKYLVRKSKRKEFVWEVKQVGKSAELVFCNDDFNEVGSLVCESLGSTIAFRMNKLNLRFLYSYLIGFWTDNVKDSKGTDILREGSNTPNIQMGKCSPL